MNIADIESSLRKAIQKLYERDTFLLNKKLDITERAITHRLGMHLQIQFKDYDVDCEYNRMGKNNNDGTIEYTDGDYFAKTVCLSNGEVPDDDDNGSRVFPDIIIHKRGTAENLAIIEVKMKWKSSKSQHDIKKLKAYKQDLKYSSAIYLELNEDDFQLEFIELDK